MKLILIAFAGKLKNPKSEHKIAEQISIIVNKIKNISSMCLQNKCHRHPKQKKKFLMSAKGMSVGITTPKMIHVHQTKFNNKFKRFE